MTTAIHVNNESIVSSAPTIASSLRLTYIAYPSSLVLRSANAVQTYATVRALRSLLPTFDVLIPRFGRRPSAFTNVGATHLFRIPFNAGHHLIRSVAWSYLERTWFAWRALVYLYIKRLRGNSPDVVYLRDIVCAFWFALAARRLVHARVIYEVHDLESEHPSTSKGALMARVARWMDRVALRRSDGIVSLTQTFLPLLRERSLLNQSGLTAIISDAYDDATYFPRDRTTARLALSLPQDVFVIGYTGLTFAYHGLDILVRTFALFLKEYPTAVLVLVGGRDSERIALATQIEALGVGDSVRLISPQPTDAIPLYLAAADVLVVPDTITKSSASPLKLFEYAAMERPIVVADLPALREILPEDTVRYVPLADEAAFAAALVWVATHREIAHSMAERARDAVAPHTYQNRAERIVAFCEMVKSDMR